jgi:hypothetical protein
MRHFCSACSSLEQIERREIGSVQRDGADHLPIDPMQTFVSITAVII